MSKIKIAIAGYGNLGRGVELSLQQNPDMELVAVFTRRPVGDIRLVDSQIPVVSMKDILDWTERVDVLVLCGGSATDLPEMGPVLAKSFNIIDSFDTHADIPDYFAAVDKSAKEGNKLGIISVGWDPGLFSLNRLYGEVVLPVGDTYTFWGKGVSQGHSDAIRRLPGVAHAVQYTVPSESAMDEARAGRGKDLTTRDKHVRDAYVVAQPGADLAEIEHLIKTMPNYFADYDTKVTFISDEELGKNHQGMPHGGFVIRSGQTGQLDKDNKQHSQVIEYSLALDSNPEFTASALVCYARAAYRLVSRDEIGARSVFDIAPALLSPKTQDELLADLL